MRSLILATAALLVSCQAEQNEANPPPPLFPKEFKSLQFAIAHSDVIAGGWAQNGSVCLIKTTLPEQHRGGDLPEFQHLGMVVYQCLQEQAPSEPWAQPWLQRGAMINLNGDCPSVGEGFVVFGCAEQRSGLIDIEPFNIGPNSVCAHGTPPEMYTPDCWRQFYRVLGHEVAHLLYGSFH